MTEDNIQPTPHQPFAGNEGHSFGVDVQETRPGQQTSESLGEVATQIPVVDGSENTHQDPVKAETVGRAAMEAESQIVKEARARGYSSGHPPVDIFDKADAENFYRATTNPTAEDINRFHDNPPGAVGMASTYERRIREAVEAGDNEEADRIRADFEENKKSFVDYEGDVSGAIDRAKELARSEYEHYTQYRKKEITAKLEPFEKLYDMSPEVFAQMPTSEFVAASKEYRQVEEYVQEKSRGLGWMQRALEELEERLQNKKGIYFDEKQHYDNIFSGNIAGFIKEANDALVSDNRNMQPIEEADKLWTEIDSKYKNIFIGTYDKSPRQIVEEAIQVTKEFVDQVADQLQDALRKRQELMKKYGINQDSEVQPQESSVESV